MASSSSPTCCVIDEQERRSVHTLLSEHIQPLYQEWGLWKSLFMKDTSVAALNEASPVAAAYIRHALLVDIVLGLARLLDPATQQGSKNNLSLERLIGDLPRSLSAFRTKLATARNKRLAHNDLKACKAGGPVEFGVTEEELEGAMECIACQLNRVAADLNVGESLYECCESDGHNEGEHFIVRIRRGVEHDLG